MLELRNPKAPASPAGWSPSPETQSMREELQALEARYRGLQSLVAELLLANQTLRLKRDRALQPEAVTAPATHPPPRPDR